MVEEEWLSPVETFSMIHVLFSYAGFYSLIIILQFIALLASLKLFAWYDGGKQKGCCW